MGLNECQVTHEAGLTHELGLTLVPRGFFHTGYWISGF